MGSFSLSKGFPRLDHPLPELVWLRYLYTTFTASNSMMEEMAFDVAFAARP